MTSIHFIVEGNPTAKGRPRFFRRGPMVGTYTPPKTETAETEIRYHAMRHRPITPWPGQVTMRIYIYCPIPKSFSKTKKELIQEGILRPISRPDWDNYGKLVSDALNGIIYQDDSQVVSCQVEKYYSETPRTEVEITKCN